MSVFYKNNNFAGRSNSDELRSREEPEYQESGNAPTLTTNNMYTYLVLESTKVNRDELYSQNSFAESRKQAIISVPQVAVDEKEVSCPHPANVAPLPYVKCSDARRICRYCFTAFANAFDRSRHEWNCSSNSICHSCDSCGIWFDTLEELTAHDDNACWRECWHSDRMEDEDYNTYDSEPEDDYEERLEAFRDECRERESFYRQRTP